MRWNCRRNFAICWKNWKRNWMMPTELIKRSRLSKWSNKPRKSSLGIWMVRRLWSSYANSMLLLIQRYNMINLYIFNIFTEKCHICPNTLHISVITKLFWNHCDPYEVSLLLQGHLFLSTTGVKADNMEKCILVIFTLEFCPKKNLNYTECFPWLYLDEWLPLKPQVFQLSCQ